MFVKEVIGGIERRRMNFLIRIKERSFPKLIHTVPQGTLKATHVSAFSYRNAGDALLPIVLRDLFNQIIGVKKWHSQHVYKFMDEKRIRKINADDFLVIGGGGLFLADTHPNDISGWQWNCSIPALSKINCPIIAFAIGYNRFRGQADFKPVFTEHLNAFVEKAAFVGIRNHGSIERLKTYLKTKKLQDKLVFQPCMTTLISKIYFDLLDYTRKEDFIAFNCAFDRKEMRNFSEERLNSIARVALVLSRNVRIKYYSHMDSDKEILPYFEKYHVPYELVEFKDVKQIVSCYTSPRLVIGMRGHAQMIPFGCGTPILSIVSHDKMQWFLDDIHHPEWGVDMEDPNFEDKLQTKAFSLYADYLSCMKEIEVEKQYLWQITQENMKTINKKILK